MKAFGLTERQANAILDTRLRQLARLEEMKLRGEHDELAEEQSELDKILNSRARMTTLMKKEIKADAEKYGDERRSAIVTDVAEAKAYAREELTSAEPITVVLSEMGWVRAAKGHDVNAGELSYRSGDRFFASAQGKSNQQLVFFDSTGRAYTQQPGELPSARGQGEPLSGRVNPPSGATFRGVALGDGEQRLLLATDGGYGFVGKLEDMVSRNRAGKAVLTVPEGTAVLPPAPVAVSAEWVAVVTTQGRLLVFPIAELPVLARGKGQKLIHIPNADVKSGAERVHTVVTFASEDTLMVYAGKRQYGIKPADREAYAGERARRGRRLPRGLQSVERFEVVPKIP